MGHVQTMGFYSSVRKNKIMKLSGQWVETKNDCREKDNQDPERQMPRAFSKLCFLVINF